MCAYTCTSSIYTRLCNNDLACPETSCCFWAACVQLNCLACVRTGLSSAYMVPHIRGAPAPWHHANRWRSHESWGDTLIAFTTVQVATRRLTSPRVIFFFFKYRPGAAAVLRAQHRRWHLHRGGMCLTPRSFSFCAETIPEHQVFTA